MKTKTAKIMTRKKKRDEDKINTRIKSTMKISIESIQTRMKIKTRMKHEDKDKYWASTLKWKVSLPASARRRTVHTGR